MLVDLLATAAVALMIVHRVLVAVAGQAPQAEKSGAVELPITWLRPIKSGVRDLGEKIGRFLDAIGPTDEVLFGVGVGSEEERLCAQLVSADPRVRVVACEAEFEGNPKVAKLARMSPLASHEVWTIADAEAVFTPDLVRRFKAELSRYDCVTVGYRFVGMQSVMEWLDSLAVVQTLWPGLILVRRFGRLSFTLGACTGFRRRDFEEAGGWEALQDRLAEDHELGKRLAANGRRIALSEAVLDLHSDPLGWSEYWRHQRRVAITYRVAEPAGAASMIVTRGFSIALVLSCLSLTPVSGTMVILAALVQMASVWQQCQSLGYRSWAPVMLCLPAELVETTCWALSWGSQTVWWSGRWRRLQPGGTFRREGACTGAS